MLKYISRSITTFFLTVVLSLSMFSSVNAAQTVDINVADAATMAAGISGIGPSKAQAIVDYRTENGLFITVDDLVNVNGIGLKTVDRIREFVTVTGAESKPVVAKPLASSVGSESATVPAN